MIIPLSLLLDARPRPMTLWEPAWSLHPTVLIGVAALAALYFWGIGPLRRRRQLGPPVEGWRIACFTGGLVVMLASLNGPIHDLSDYYLFWVHMAQHLLLTMVLPPLLLAGTPGWLLEPLLRRPAVRGAARIVTHPVVAVALFTGSLVLWHTIAAYDLIPGAPNHPKGEANGYLITLGGRRIYFAGVTECVPELRALKNVDVAFMPMNIPPARMTPSAAAECVKLLKPKVVYINHYDQDTAGRLTGRRAAILPTGMSSSRQRRMKTRRAISASS